MPYLIDANCFIEPKNRYYGFDFCPGFWDWLEQQNKVGVVFSIANIAVELKHIQDELARWAQQRGSTFFLPLDPLTITTMSKIVTWVNDPSAGFSPQQIQIFLKCADPFLIAYALAHNYTIVTHEVSAFNKTGKKTKIKIPDVCQQFNVPCITIFDLLRQEKARLII